MTYLTLFTSQRQKWAHTGINPHVSQEGTLARIGVVTGEKYMGSYHVLQFIYARHL